MDRERDELTRRDWTDLWLTSAAQILPEAPERGLRHHSNARGGRKKSSNGAKTLPAPSADPPLFTQSQAGIWTRS